MDDVPLVIVGGEALVDLILGADGTVRPVLGGGPYNTARTIARLGGSVAFAASLSTDRFGKQLRQALVDDGVSTGLITSTDLPTTLALAELDESGSASYRFYFEATAAPAFAGSIPAHVAAIHVGTLGLVLEPMASTLATCVLNVSPQTLVMIDANCRPSATPNVDRYVARLREICACAHVLKISREDLEFLAEHCDASEPAHLLTWGPTVVLHTDGGSGVDIVTARGSQHVPALPIDVVDTIGAGDSFGGGFLAWWLQRGLGVEQLDDDALLYEAVSIAAQVAAITCTRAGADPPGFAEVPGWPTFA